MKQKKAFDLCKAFSKFLEGITWDAPLQTASDKAGYSISHTHEVHEGGTIKCDRLLPMKPYSIDLRSKIIEIWKRENISIRKLAKRFGVSQSFIQKLIKKYQETGNIRPLSQGGSPPSKLNSEQLVILVQLMEKNNDATFEELSELLEKATGVKVGKSTIGRISQKLNYSLKKNFICP